jgi:hypothetical protein
MWLTISTSKLATVAAIEGSSVFCSLFPRFSDMFLQRGCVTRTFSICPQKLKFSNSYFQYSWHFFFFVCVLYSVEIVVWQRCHLFRWAVSSTLLAFSLQYRFVGFGRLLKYRFVESYLLDYHFVRFGRLLNIALLGWAVSIQAK